MNRFKHFCSITWLLWVATAPSNAITTLSVFDGTTTVTIVDNDSNDTSPGAGTITWVGSIGVWDVSVGTGQTQPALGNTTDPNMSLSGVNHSTSPGTLTITFTDTGFISLPVFAMTSFGGTQDGTNSSVSYVTLQGANVITDTGSIIETPFSTGSIGSFGTSTNPPPLAQAGPYSLSQVVTIVRGDSGTTSFGASLASAVPEPQLPICLIGMGLGTWRALRSRATARLVSQE